MASTTGKKMKSCLRCGAVIHRRSNAKFCSHECLRAETDEQAAEVRRTARAALRLTCVACEAPFVPGTLPALFCSPACRKSHERLRWSEKIASYRRSDPARYRAHRDRENDKRRRQRAAFQALRELNIV